MFDKFIDLFLNLIKISTKEITNLILLSLHSLCKMVQWYEDIETNVLSKHMQKLYEPILQLCSNVNLFDKDDNIILSGFFVLAILGERTANDAKIQMSYVFHSLTEMFDKTITQKNSFQSIDIVNSYQEYLCSCLTGFLLTGCAEINDCGNLLQYILSSFQQRNDLFEEGITTIGAISLRMGKDFEPAMQSISQYLLAGLRAVNSPDICGASIYCLSDIIRALEVSFSKYVNDYIPLVMNILSNQFVDRKLKPQCFNILSDMFLYCPEEACKLFSNIMKIIGEAIPATQEKLGEDSDPDNIKYFINLREHILETLTAIFCTINEYNKTKEFINYVKPILTYIFEISTDLCAYSLEIIKTGLFLVADFCKAYPTDIGVVLNADIIKGMYEKIESSSEYKEDSQTQNSLAWAKKLINNAFQNNK